MGVVLPDMEAPSSDCEVWPEHWAALDVFLLCQEQWVSVGEMFVGLDLDRVLQAARMCRIRDLRQLWEDVQVISQRAATLLNEARSKGG
jgi:hypothetical protein